MGTPELEHHLLLEHMRATLRYAMFECGHTQEEIAARAGVSPPTLKRLLDGGGLAYPSYGRILGWCETYGIEQAYPEQAALSLLVSHYPVRERRRAREYAVRWMKTKLLRTGHRLPVWMEKEIKSWPKR
jgi:transcriptional regulator with XRE-family HTH domain